MEGRGRGCRGVGFGVPERGKVGRGWEGWGQVSHYICVLSFVCVNLFVLSYYFLLSTFPVPIV